MLFLWFIFVLRCTLHVLQQCSTVLNITFIIHFHSCVQPIDSPAFCFYVLFCISFDNLQNVWVQLDFSTDLISHNLKRELSFPSPAWDPSRTVGERKPTPDWSPYEKNPQIVVCKIDGPCCQIILDDRVDSRFLNPDCTLLSSVMENRSKGQKEQRAHLRMSLSIQHLQTNFAIIHSQVGNSPHG